MQRALALHPVCVPLARLHRRGLRPRRTHHSLSLPRNSPHSGQQGRPEGSAPETGTQKLSGSWAKMVRLVWASGAGLAPPWLLSLWSDQGCLPKSVGT